MPRSGAATRLEFEIDELTTTSSFFTAGNARLAVVMMPPGGALVTDEGVSVLVCIVCATPDTVNMNTIASSQLACED